MNDAKRRSGDSGSLGKALEILRHFVDRQERWGVRELATALGLPSSTVHRFLRILAGLGYLRFDQETRKYRVGMELYRIAAILGERLRIRDIALRPMNDLAGAILQPVWLAVYDDAMPSMVVAAEAGGRQLLGSPDPLGARLPLAMSAEGQAVLAFLPSDQQRAILADASELPDGVVGAAGLQEIRDRGYAVFQSGQGGNVVSAPVLDAQERPIASLSTRANDPLDANAASALCNAARQISQALGSRLLGGGRAGTWHVGIRAIADLINQHVPGIGITTEGGGGDRNLDDLERGIANYCLAVSASVDAAFEGRPPFRWAHTRLAVMFSVFPLYLHIVARPGLAVHRLCDLVGLRISPADRGFTTATLFDRLMELAGFSAAQLAKGGTRISHLDYAEANRQLQDGHLDVVLSLSGIPNPAYIEIVKALPISLIGIEDEVVTRLSSHEPGYSPGIIPGGTYPGIAGNVSTVQIPTVMTTVADRPDDEVYEITRAVFERKSELVRAVAAFERFGSDFVLQGFRTPLHPGARRYWRECGLLAGN